MAKFLFIGFNRISFELKKRKYEYANSANNPNI